MIAEVTTAGSYSSPVSQPAQQIDTTRKQHVEKPDVETVSQGTPKVQPEEFLSQVKALTQDGAYSVRFERSDQIADVVVKIYDNQTNEVIRQIPAEELMNFKVNFAEMVGSLVDKKA